MSRWLQRIAFAIRRMLPVPKSTTTVPIMLKTEKNHIETLRRADALNKIVEDYRRQDAAFKLHPR